MFLPLLLFAATLHAGPERILTPPVANASPYGQSVTDVSAGDDVALIVWEEDFGKFGAARVDRDGRRLDQRPIILAAGGQAARGTDGWLVAGHVYPNVIGQIVHDDGTAGEAFTIAEESAVEQVRVAFDGSYFLVVWKLRESFHAVRLDPAGNIVERDIGFHAQVRYAEIDLVALESGFAVVTLHVNDFTKNEYTVEVFRYNENADLLAYGWLDRTSTSEVRDLHATADGNTIVAAWRSDSVGNSGMFVAREGEPLRLFEGMRRPIGITMIGGTAWIAVVDHHGPVSLVSEDGREGPDLPSTSSVMVGSFGDRALLAATTSGVHSDVVTTVVDTSLQEVAPAELLALEPALQERPSIARGPNGQSLVVWMESHEGDAADVMGMRVDGAGRPIDAQPLVIAEGIERAPWFVCPRVATDGEEWLVVWNANGNLRSRRVLRDGTLEGSAASIATTAFDQGEICVAWNGREYLTGYIGADTTGVLTAFTAPVSRDNVPGAATRLTSDGTSLGVACAAAGGDTLFAWLSGATIVRDDGTTSGPLPLTHVTAITSDGERFAVAGDVRSGDWDVPVKIDRAMVSRQGTVTHVAEPPILGEQPALAATRDGFVLAWGLDDLYALELDAEGRAVGEPFALSATPLRENQVALAGGDVPIAVYMRELPSPPERRYRIFARTLTDGGPRRRAVRN